MAGVKAVDMTWKLIKSMFSYSSTSAIVSKIITLGFDAFTQTTLIQSYVGIPAEKLTEFKEFIIKSVEVPQDKLETFREMWNWAEFTESGTWKYDNTVYTTDSQGNGKYITCLYSKDFETNKYTIFVSDIKSNFNVAEDMYVWQKQKSMFGGLFQSDKMVF